MYKKYKIKAVISSSHFPLINSFRLWLLSQSLSPSTVKNYLVDIKKYLSGITPSQVFSPPSLNSYIAQINGQKNYRRQLASLAKFCQYAQDQHLVTSNPLTVTEPDKDVNLLLQDFHRFLKGQNIAPATIKTYLHDIKQYLDFINSHPV